jgi:CheY-like chemotaxis protein
MVPRQLHFLLVEDDDDHAELVLRNLRKQHDAIDVDRVPDGVEALSYLRHEGDYAQKPKPDVILLDLNMPRMSGHEVLLHVKQDPVLQKIPVVIFTTSDNVIDRSRAYEHHVNSYLVKPVDFNEFQATAQELGLYWGTMNRPVE